MTTVKENACAKINLYLDVVGKRADGYHDVKTLMHTVDLSDEITVSMHPSGKRSVHLFVEGNHFLPTDGKNLAVKAAHLFLDRIGLDAEISIKLVKNIPVAAGLAGGSADAAAVLRALNKIFKKPFTRYALAKMAEELGSDVPYCVLGGTALCEGRGELVTHVKTELRLITVIVSSGEHISTPEAYSELDRKYSDFDGSIPNGSVSFDCMKRSLSDGGIKPETLYNSFEEAILPKCPIASRAKERLLELGAYAAMMSGSGPSVFGLFDTEEKAAAAAAKLNEEGMKAFVAKTV